MKDEIDINQAKKKFIKSMAILGFAVIYLISPYDLIPGPPPFEWIEDIPFLIISMIFAGINYYKLKKARETEKSIKQIQE